MSDRARGLARARDVAILCVGVTLVAGLYRLGWWNSTQVARSVVPVVALLVVGIVVPKAALSFALASPFLFGMSLPFVPTGELEGAGVLLAAGVILGTTRSGAHAEPRPASRAVARILLAFGLINLLVLFLLPHEASPTRPLFQTTLHAIFIALAVSRSRLSLVSVARMLAPAGCVVSWTALVTPEILVDRSTSVAGTNANGVGMVASICLVIAVVGVIVDQGAWRLAHLVAAMSCLLGMLVSQSRGAYLNLAIAGLVLLASRLLIRRSLTGWMGVGLVAGAAVWLGDLVVRWAGTWTGRFAGAQMESESLDARWTAAVYSFEQGILHPLGGVGIANLAAYSSEHRGDSLVRSHIVYLGVWGEVGIPAALLLGLICWRALAFGRQAGRAPLAVISAVLVAGMSVNWWPSIGTGSVALAVLAWAAASLRAGSERVASSSAGHGKRDAGAARQHRIGLLSVGA